MTCGFTSTSVLAATKAYKARKIKPKKDKRFKNSKVTKVKPRKARKRQLSFLRRPSRCEFKAVDDRLVRHKGADDIIPRILPSKQSYK